MFFHLGPDPDLRFPCHDRVLDLCFSHDLGWTAKSDGFYKGYDHLDLEHGNSLRLQIVDDRVHFQHDGLRSFPLWWNRDRRILTNLLGDSQRIWADGDVIAGLDQFEFVNKEIITDVVDTSLQFYAVVDAVAQNIKAKFRALMRDQILVPKRLFLTGGIDTLTLYALCPHDGSIVFLDHEHFEYDTFTNINMETIRRDHWAYRQMHHWCDPTILISGACGDEFMMRGPAAVAVWCAWHDIDLMQKLDGVVTYHSRYYQKHENAAIFHSAWQNRHELKNRYATLSDLNRAVLDIIVNDHQHWHLGHTLTWTPFKDLELTKLILRMEPDDILRQITDAAVNREVISQHQPSCLAWLSRSKNSDTRMWLPDQFTHS